MATKTIDPMDELTRIVAPFDANILANAIAGKRTRFDVDGTWYAHHHGHPRCVGKIDAFDDRAMLAGIQAVCWLGTQLPAGDARRAAVPALYAKIVARLANPELLVYSGSPERRPLEGGSPHRCYDWRGNELREGVDTGALVDSQNYLYFRPAKLADEADLVRARAGAELHYPNQTFPWSGLFHAWRVIASPGVVALVERAGKPAIPAGSYELDPRRSVPALVAEVAQHHGLPETAATLYLQLLALVDCGDTWLRQVNAWSKREHDRAGDALVAAGLVTSGKQLRANRKLALPGTWEPLFPPHPAIERNKLALYDAHMDGKGLAAPLGRVLPLRPIDELFAEAWRCEREAADRPATPHVAHERDWIAELRAAPHDDELRGVYGDWLSERGDPRGELIAVQCRRVALARDESPDDARQTELARLEAAETKLVKQHGEAWSEAIHPYVEGYRFDRGFITSITVRAPKFAKHAAAIASALPLLEELVPFNTGGIGPIPRKHVDLLCDCPQFARIRRLDFTPDHYLSTDAELRALLDGRHFPKLRYLRLGYHRGGEGFGQRGAELVAECARLSELAFLEVPGNNWGAKALAALFASPHLAKLEMLRVPYNGLRNGGADSLIVALERGALPSLRVLDVSNVLDADGITKACSFHRNRVTLDRQQRILHVLAERAEAAGAYDGDPAESTASRPAQGGFTGQILEQRDGFPYAALAKSGTSRCIVCKKKIPIRTLRIGVERMLDAVGKVTSWVHPGCRAECPELQQVPDLEARLSRNSGKLWPP